MSTIFDVLSNLPDRVALGDLDSLVLISLRELEQGVNHNSAGKRVDNYIDALIGFRNSIEGTTIDFGIPYDGTSYAAGKRLGEKALENISKLRSINSYSSIKTADLVFDQFRKFTSKLEDEFRSLRFILNHTYLFLIDGIAGQDSNEVNADSFKTALAFEFNRHYKWVSRLARGDITKGQATKLKGKHTANNYMKLGLYYLFNDKFDDAKKFFYKAADTKLASPESPAKFIADNIALADRVFWPTYLKIKRAYEFERRS